MEASKSGRADQVALERLDDLLGRRYGRDGDLVLTGRPVSLLEAGYATVGVSSGLQASLDRQTTSFQTEQLNTRLDLMLKDLLTHPQEAATEPWAWRYGYSSPSAASRAFRKRFMVQLGDARRIGQLGRWLAMAQRQPRADVGHERRDEAVARIYAFRRAVGGALGPRAKETLDAIGAPVPPDSAIPRPRYPAVSASERQRLARSAW